MQQPKSPTGVNELPLMKMDFCGKLPGQFRKLSRKVPGTVLHRKAVQQVNYENVQLYAASGTGLAH